MPGLKRGGVVRRRNDVRCLPVNIFTSDLPPGVAQKSTRRGATARTLRMRRPNGYSKKLEIPSKRLLDKNQLLAKIYFCLAVYHCCDISWHSMMTDSFLPVGNALLDCRIFSREFGGAWERLASWFIFCESSVISSPCMRF